MTISPQDEGNIDVGESLKSFCKVSCFWMVKLEFSGKHGPGETRNSVAGSTGRW